VRVMTACACFHLCPLLPCLSCPAHAASLDAAELMYVWPVHTPAAAGMPASWCFGLYAATCRWSGTADEGVTLTADDTIGGLAGSVLVINPAALPTSEAVTYSVQLTDAVGTVLAVVHCHFSHPRTPSNCSIEHL